MAVCLGKLTDEVFNNSTPDLAGQQLEHLISLRAALRRLRQLPLKGKPSCSPCGSVRRWAAAQQTIG
ncbi:MAG: hypothetical protein II072_01515 [Clostridia bacterium]|nr:hypothetical protein [Clostridia bacterium]